MISRISRNVYNCSRLYMSTIQSREHNIVIVGSGSIGLYYGGRLLQKELESSSSLSSSSSSLSSSSSPINVKFIARNYYKTCNDNGYSIKSIDGDVTFSTNDVKDKFYNDANALLNKNKDIIIDWIIITIKSYAILDIKNTIDPLIASNDNARIILIINGYGVDHYFKQWYGADKVFVALAFTCINRIINKDNNNNNNNNNITSVLIDHSAVGHLLIGHSNNNILELNKLNDLFVESKIRVETTDSLITTIWRKLTWNICFNGLSVALGGVTTDVIANGYFRLLASNIMKEIIELANDDIKEHYSSLNIDATEYLIDPKFQDVMWKYTDDMGVYKTSSAIDLVNGNELEIEYLFTNVWNRAIHHSKKKLSTKLNTQEQSLYPYIDSLMKTVHGVAEIAKQKRLQNIKWNATYF